MNSGKCACAVRVAGRGLFGLVMAVFGVMHLMNASDMVGYVPAYLPVPLALVYLTGVIMLVGGVALLFNKCAKWPAVLLGLSLLSYALLIHLPAMAEAGPTNLLKDLALSGAAFYFAGACCMGQCSTTDKKDSECC